LFRVGFGSTHWAWENRILFYFFFIIPKIETRIRYFFPFFVSTSKKLLNTSYQSLLTLHHSKLKSKIDTIIVCAVLLLVYLG
jgi:hypothetical protein